ncbi:hypothetical protein [Pseudomonas multiresinivorans]|uniref:Uncharacterized protein n=1 Tax=Pseudomonas multiresinivorans TaxID=95301 RepID=A0A7Z3BLD8_9PSED|nr:hypothetical protein [Pseudomonas multiresinivorans]QJP09042.1 hypothetical protein G4G71_14585 [Pseudomonas multiresinivorans]
MDFTEFYRELQRIGCVEEEFPSRVAAVLYACFDAGLSVEQTRRFMSRFMLIKSVGECLASDHLGPETIERIVAAESPGLMTKDLLSIFSSDQLKPEFRPHSSGER